MNNKLKCVFLFVAFTFLSFTQRTFEVIDESVIRFFGAVQMLHQEKLYLHLDKPYYAAGDSIWFKGYLVNATTHVVDLPDNFIYIELVDRKDSIVYRKKIRRENDIFQGNIPLFVNIQEGEYYIRAYSNWMRNTGEDFFYTRKIKVANSIDVSIRSIIEYVPVVGEKEEKMDINIRFMDSANKPFERMKMKCILYTNNEKVKEKILSSDEDGLVSFSCNKKDLADNSYIETEFMDSKYEYQKIFYVPNSSSDFSMTFFPEGGYLLTNVNQRVAFKCQQANGFSKNVFGAILNSHKDTITLFKATHDGMGAFFINARSGEQYVAKVDGSDECFNLPKSIDRGFALSMEQVNNMLHYQVLSASETVWPDSFYLVAHTRGFPILVQALTRESSTGVFSLENLPEGISHFLLVNGEGKPISQRLVFVYPSIQPLWDISCDKDRYDKRDKVTMNISLSTLDGLPLNGDFSISITDNKTVKPDSLADNIISNLLLTSDLKGYIDNPGYYFSSKNRKVLKDLDLVMLTHGWSRFNIDCFKDELSIAPKYFIEKGQFLSGRIKNLIGKTAKNAQIMALEPRNMIFKEFQTDENGVFLLEGIDYKDSCTFVIQARSKKGLATVNVEPDMETIPEKIVKIPFRNDSLLQINEDYLFNTREKYYYEGGMRVYNLKEVIVRGNKSSEERVEDMRRILWADYSMTPEMLKKSHARTANDLYKQAYPFGPEYPSIVVIDGMVCLGDEFILSTILGEDIQSFDLYKDQSKSQYGSFGQEKGPAVVITMRPGAMQKGRKGIAWFRTLGYSKMAEFYSPVYDTPEKKMNNIPDLRTTIYWSPALRIDSTGIATVEFYTSDSPSSYNIEIEGITTEGKVCRYQGGMR